MDPRVIDTLNRDFVPVWVNIRNTRLPELPDREEVLMGTLVDRKGRVIGPAAQGFFLRILVLEPSDLSLLNRQAQTARASTATFLKEGHYAYAQAKARHLLPMLHDALQAREALRGGALTLSAEPEETR
ncbi:MAG TPA: hypothetical protein ENK18_17305 [Deltaproteobacteria bacterium]|nr:hypothetical protein [Deltaproteobacteria bacterium]